jgi:hypothetical protein
MSSNSKLLDFNLKLRKLEFWLQIVGAYSEDTNLRFQTSGIPTKKKNWISRHPRNRVVNFNVDLFTDIELIRYHCKV